MCWFVTIAVPSVSRSVVSELAAKYGQLSVHPVPATPTTRGFPQGHSCFEVTHGGCSCALFAEPQPDIDAVLKKERAQLMAKGWTEAKISRSLASRSEALSRPKSRGPEGEMFRSLVSDLVRRGLEVRTYAHFGSTDLPAERVGQGAECSISLETFLASGFPSDTVTLVRGALDGRPSLPDSPRNP